MNAVFADTFYWIAFTNIRDLAHQKVKLLMQSSPRELVVTTEAVLTEYLNYFAAWGPTFRQKSLLNVRNILKSESVKVVPQTTALFLGSLALYGARLDKGYSMTDCISMQTMRAEGIADVLTNDMHFEQEGFRALFRHV